MKWALAKIEELIKGGKEAPEEGNKCGEGTRKGWEEEMWEEPRTKQDNNYNIKTTITTMKWRSTINKCQ